MYTYICYTYIDMDPYKYLDEYEVRKQSTPNATEAQKVTSPAI